MATRGEACPDHGIYCHKSGTYSYKDVRRNIIVSPDLFATRIVGHPFKFDSSWLHLENSEDALSWNVFRSLQEAGRLAQAAKLLVGEDHPEQPDLYVWGIRISDDSCEPWDLLIAAREKFESNLPVKRPLTEPDIALHLPGRYLVLIEAKFASPNPFYVRGPRKDSRSLTLDELLNIYWDSSLSFLDRSVAQSRDRIYYQFWRNMVFAEWMAATESTATTAYHVNLVRAGYEAQSATQFREILIDTYRRNFSQCSWESLLANIHEECSHTTLLRYFNEKTTSLRQAFNKKSAS